MEVVSGDNCSYQKSKCHHQQTNALFFTRRMPFLLLKRVRVLKGNDNGLKFATKK